MIRIALVIAFFLFLANSFGSNSNGKSNSLSYSNFIQTTYGELKFEGQKPDIEIYRKGLTGYLNLRKNKRLSDSALLTLIDFRLSSNKKRMWIIDLKQHKVIHHSLVAHGRNTGNEFAENFSDVPNSNSSSLGFYTTAETYYGKHGLSLRLDGLEKGFNGNARERAIVIHSAAYVSKGFSKNYGRIGRSLGCPSIPVKGHEEIINKLANGNCLFIYYPDEEYLQNSQLTNEITAFEILNETGFLL